MLRRLISQVDRVVNQPTRLRNQLMKLLLRQKKGLIDVSENANRSGFKEYSRCVECQLWESGKLDRNKRPILQVLRRFTVMDHMTTGFHEEELIIIAARPAVGKTALPWNIAPEYWDQLE